MEMLDIFTGYKRRLLWLSATPRGPALMIICILEEGWEKFIPGQTPLSVSPPKSSLVENTARVNPEAKTTASLTPGQPCLLPRCWDGLGVGCQAERLHGQEGGCWSQTSVYSQLCRILLCLSSLLWASVSPYVKWGWYQNLHHTVGTGSTRHYHC